MSTPINNGGPAFPTTPVRTKDGKTDPDFYHGMTLRDYIATSKTILPHELEYVQAGGYKAEAFIRYRYADAMLAERNKTT